MKVRLISVGSKMAQWVQQGIAEYEKRMGKELGFSIVEVALQRRSKSRTIDQCRQKEGEALLSRVQRDDFVVALEVNGKTLDTATLARHLDELKLQGRNLSFLIGGPDGLSADCRARANACWSLSGLTFPHPLVRILLTEQLYRASCILKGHPYHRE
jgi:23S rRNA (pseudouridine1915-N3)-methyltransferase